MACNKYLLTVAVSRQCLVLEIREICEMMDIECLAQLCPWELCCASRSMESKELGWAERSKWPGTHIPFEALTLCYCFSISSWRRGLGNVRDTASAFGWRVRSSPESREETTAAPVR